MISLMRCCRTGPFGLVSLNLPTPPLRSYRSFFDSNPDFGTTTSHAAPVRRPISNASTAQTSNSAPFTVQLAVLRPNRARQ